MLVGREWTLSAPARGLKVQNEDPPGRLKSPLRIPHLAVKTDVKNCT